jgi:hypothetical protein
MKRAPPPRVPSSLPFSRPFSLASATRPAASYWHDSRSPRYSLTFALPLLVVYEGLAAALSQESRGIRNGADVLLKSAFQSVIGANGQLVFGVILVGTMLALIVRASCRGAQISWEYSSSRSRRGLGPSWLLPLKWSGRWGGAQGVGLTIGSGLDGVGWPTAPWSRWSGALQELLFRVLLVSVLLQRPGGLRMGPVASDLRDARRCDHLLGLPLYRPVWRPARAGGFTSSDRRRGVQRVAHRASFGATMTRAL